jgi:hypothetical protein
MKTIAMVLVVAAAVLLLASCPMPTVLGVQPGQLAAESEAAPAARIPTVETDVARGLAVFVDEAGVRTDIVGVNADGASVLCAEAYSVTALGDEDGAKAFGSGPSKWIVIGRHPDGWPGAWIILADRTIVAAFNEVDGRESFRFPDCSDRGMGWKYFLTGWASDGRLMIVTGYAKNERGIRHGRWAVDPGTTVGVYWKILTSPKRPWHSISRARVIGTPDPEIPFPGRGRHHHRPNPRLWGMLAQLKLFLLDAFKTYLVMTEKDGTAYDTARSLFTVKGTDQDGQPAVATIDGKDSITITQVEASDKPDLAVMAVQVPAAPVQVGGQFATGAEVKNQGPGDAPASKVSFYLSNDSAFGSDSFLGDADLPVLGVGETATVAMTGSASVADPGTHWIFAVVDPDDSIAENDETNNSSSAVVAVIYPRLVIDTYRPTAEGFGTTDTYLSLFGGGGDPSLESGSALWLPDSSALAEDDGGNPRFVLFARIDHTAGVAPGTYYVRLRGATSTENGAYAIRVLTTADPDAYPSSVYFSGNNQAEVSPSGAAYEIDDNPTSGGIPANPVAIGINTPLNRYLEAGDIDWFKLVLP